MIILGIDPGTAETGFGIIETAGVRLKLILHGTIKTTTENSSSHRLNSIYTQANSLMVKYHPKCVVLESLFFFSNAVSVMGVGQTMGVIKLAAHKNKAEVYEYPPLRVKMVITGSGKAQKSEIQSQVRKELRLQKIPRPTHAADALAVAICHWKSCNSPKESKRC